MTTRQRRILRQVLSLAALAAVVVLVVTTVHRRNTGNDQAPEEPGIVTDQSARYEALTYHNGSATLSFALNEQEKWVWADVPDFPLDEQYVTAILDHITGLTPQQTLTEPEAPESYGLDDPAMTLTAASSDGTELRVDIGKEVAGGSGSRYLMLRGDASTVYIVDGSLAEELTRPIYDMMRLPKATDIPAENFRGLMLIREERSAPIMTAAGEDAPLVWRCSGEDVTGDARLDAVLTLLSGLAPARCLDYNPSPEAVSLCGFDTPLIVTARYQSGETEQMLRLEIGGLNVDGTERCFRLGEDTTIYTLPLAELEPLLALEQAFLPPAAAEEAAA